MSKAQRARRAIKWARYANRYADNLGNVLGGWGIVRAMNTAGPRWRYVRRQAKRTWTAQEES